MTVRALRGATTAVANEAGAIIESTGELLAELLERNEVATGDVISIVFTATPDLNAEFPAAAARGMGLAEVPLLCAQEIAVPGSVPLCIRVLIHLETDRPASELRHVYLHGARGLRSDLE